MSFFWGKKDEFEKDNNTIREVYSKNCSNGFLMYQKYSKIPVVIIKHKHNYNSYEDTDTLLSNCNGLIFNSNVDYSAFVEYSEFVEYTFLHRNYEDVLDELKGGAVYKSDVVYDSFVEYCFLHFPLAGAYSDSLDNLIGGMIFELEVTYDG